MAEGKERCVTRMAFLPLCCQRPLALEEGHFDTKQAPPNFHTPRCRCRRRRSLALDFDGN